MARYYYCKAMLCCVSAAVGAVGTATAQERTEGTVALSTAGAGYDWSGYYAGLSLGYASGGSTAIPIDDGAPDNDLEGAALGGQVGYNFQRGTMVYGVEADLTFGGIETPSTDSGCTSVHCEYVDINWMASLRGRVGVATDRALYYGLLGFAVADVTAIDWDAGPESADNRHNGYVVGVGMEYGLSDTMSAKVEYNYVDFSDEIYDLGTPDAVEFDASVVKLGVNFQF